MLKVSTTELAATTTAKIATAAAGIDASALDAWAASWTCKHDCLEAGGRALLVLHRQCTVSKLCAKLRAIHLISTFDISQMLQPSFRTLVAITVGLQSVQHVFVLNGCRFLLLFEDHVLDCSNCHLED